LPNGIVAGGVTDSGLSTRTAVATIVDGSVCGATKPLNLATAEARTDDEKDVFPNVWAPERVTRPNATAARDTLYFITNSETPRLPVRDR
jgi:hypothetical protein